MYYGVYTRITFILLSSHVVLQFTKQKPEAVFVSGTFAHFRLRTISLGLNTLLTSTFRMFFFLKSIFFMGHVQSSLSGKLLLQTDFFSYHQDSLFYYIFLQQLFFQIILFCLTVFFLFARKIEFCLNSYFMSFDKKKKKNVSLYENYI